MLQLLKNEEEIDYTPFLNFQSQLSILTDMHNFSFWVLESFIKLIIFCGYNLYVRFYLFVLHSNTKIH